MFPLKFLKVKLHSDYIIAIGDKQLKYGKVQKLQKVKHFTFIMFSR